MTVNGKLERMWNEAIVAKFKALSHHLPGGIVGNHEKSQSRYSVSGSRFELDTFQVHIGNVTSWATSLHFISFETISLERIFICSCHFLGVLIQKIVIFSLYLKYNAIQVSDEKTLFQNPIAEMLASGCTFIYLQIPHTRSRDSAVGIATGYRLDGGVRVPVGIRFFSSPRRPERLCSPPNRGLFPRGKVAGAWSWPLTFY
jgi:hypothetical protein